MTPGAEPNAIDGTPYCAASRTLIPKPSLLEVSRLHAALASTGRTSSTLPISAILSLAPDSAMAASNRPCSGPEP